jgi:uncharacterized protein
MRKIILLIVLFSCSLGFAQVTERPSPQRLYNNLSKEFPNFLNEQEARQVEEKLEAFSNETSNQICVVVVDDLNGTTAADYATQLINQWGIGKKDKNNGIAILIKPTKTGNGKRDLFIAVGYGLESAIPDLATKRIREEEMNPYLKQGQYFTAVDRGTDKLMALAKGEINVKDYARQNSPEGFLKNHQLLFIIIIVIIFYILKNLFGGGGGGGFTYTGRGRHTYWGGFGGFGGGGSWGGSSGGGGWGGFGGGSSGGGGSGGSW